jgi:hypothetical protein
LTIAAIVLYRPQYRPQPRPAAGPGPYKSPDFNYSFVLPGPPWQRDEATRDRLRANAFAFHRTDPDAWVALAVRDLPKHVPNAVELREEALRHLRRLFPDLQLEDAPGGELGGRPAARLVFQGSVGDAVMSGDCHMADHQGFAFWLFRWCPAGAVESLKDELGGMPGRFGFLNQRPGWQPPRTTFTGSRVAYALTADGDRWSKAPSAPADYDPRADLVLEAREREGEPPRRATLIVFVMPAEDGGELVERAKAYLLKRQQEIYPETRLDEVPAAEATAPAHTVGTAPGRVLHLKVTNRPERERLVVLGVVPRPGGPIVLWGECDYAQRSLWEPQLRRLMASFRPPT